MYSTFCLPTYQLMDIWVIFTFWLLWIVLLWMFVYEILLEYLFSVLWGIHLGLELLGLIIILCLTCWETARLFFHSNCIIFYFHQQYTKFSVSPHPHLCFLFGFFFFMVAILISVIWYLMIALICISLTTSEVEYLFMCLLTTCTSSLEKSLFRSFAQF